MEDNSVTSQAGVKHHVKRILMIDFPTYTVVAGLFSLGTTLDIIQAPWPSRAEVQVLEERLTFDEVALEENGRETRRTRIDVLTVKLLLLEGERRQLMQAGTMVPGSLDEEIRQTRDEIARLQVRTDY